MRFARNCRGPGFSQASWERWPIALVRSRATQNGGEQADGARGQELPCGAHTPDSHEDDEARDEEEQVDAEGERVQVDRGLAQMGEERVREGDVVGQHDTERGETA
ncbi:hypothetical protein GY12_04135 [Micrococcus luteus]|nr:hypothetical protein GY12_04135 [Micrococcus luteus]